MTLPRWPAPVASGPIHAVVEVPGSKSITNRAVVLAALAAGPSLIRNPLRSRDTELMVAALVGLGTAIETAAGGSWRVDPATLRGAGTIDCGLAGTVMRFVPPVAALAEGSTRFDGDSRAGERPMAAMLGALRELGASIPGGDRLPFVVEGHGRLRGGRVRLDASASSQFISGLLLAAPRTTEGVEVVHVGAQLPSLPHIRMTVAMLRAGGVEVDDTATNRWRVEPAPLRSRDVDVEPDLSNAAPFLAAALLTGGETTVPGWPADTTQPGDQLRELLAGMGGECRVGADGLLVRGAGRIHGIDANLGDVGELVPTITALAAVADSPSTLRGIAHLRGHESDRLAALAREINALGGQVTPTDDGLVIRPRPLRGGVFRTYADHRMATTGALLGLVTPGIEVEDVATTAKTLPDFVAMWDRMLGRAA